MLFQFSTWLDGIYVVIELPFGLESNIKKLVIIFVKNFSRILKSQFGRKNLGMSLLCWGGICSTKLELRWVCKFKLLTHSREKLFRFYQKQFFFFSRKRNSKFLIYGFLFMGDKIFHSMYTFFLRRLNRDLKFFKKLKILAAIFSNLLF